MSSWPYAKTPNRNARRMLTAKGASPLPVILWIGAALLAVLVLIMPAVIVLAMISDHPLIGRLFGRGLANIPAGTVSIKGIDPVASAALTAAGFTAADVTQGLGDASASRGFHHAEPNSRYTAAVDIRVAVGDETSIRDQLHRLRLNGFAAWYRNWAGNQHIHAVYAGIPVKSGLEEQIMDFLGLPNKRLGLGSSPPRDGIGNFHNKPGHQVETVMPPTEEEVAAVGQVYNTMKSRCSVRSCP